MTAPSALLLAGVLSACTFAQDCPPPPPPLTVAPIQDVDADTLLFGAFDGGSTEIEIPGVGPAQVKTTYVAPGTAGVFGSGALRITGPGAGIYRLPPFGSNAGTIEFWVRPALDTVPKQSLFSARGARSLDNDRWTDLVVGEPGDDPNVPGEVRIYYGTPTGLDVANPASLTAYVARGLGAEDLDRDGAIDLVICNNNKVMAGSSPGAMPGAVTVYRGPIGAGSNFAVPDDEFGVPLPQGLVLADFDQDGSMDMVVGSYAAGTAAVGGWLNDGNGTLQPAFAPLGMQFMAAAEGLAAGDTNKDGVLDVLYGSFDTNPSQLLRGSLGGFGYDFDVNPGATFPVAEQSLGCSVSDIDADGHVDVILAQPLFDNGPGQVSGRIAIHLNDGTGSFSSTPTFSVPTPRPFTVNASKDLNNDGALDIVVANWRNGSMTTAASRVMLGPIRASAPAPEEVEFLVDDAVSMALGDMNGDGIDDIFFHSATATESPVFYLTADAKSRAGEDLQGRQLPSVLIPTVPTLGNLSGEGAGLMAVNPGGTTTYGTRHGEQGNIELFVEDDELVFTIVDRRNQKHVVKAPAPRPDHPDNVDGFVHVMAEWDGAAGLVELRVGFPGAHGNTFTTTETPWTPGALAPVFRLGTDFDNLHPAKSWLVDEFRVSRIRRSQLDADGDNVPDEWDNCPTTFNTDQADADGDGFGDACVQCAQDLGFGGPGDVLAVMCGRPLCEGVTTDLIVSGGPPFAPAFVALGVDAVPVSAKGGLFVPSPLLVLFDVNLNGSGRLQLPVPGSEAFGPVDVVVQVPVVDPQQPVGVAFSNALRVSFP